MADLIMIKEILLKNGMKKKKNNLMTTSYSSVDNSTPPTDNSTPPKVVVVHDSESSTSLIFNIVSFIIMCFAAYLSWSCNTAMGLPILLKIIYGFLSFVFGTIYLIYYLLFRSDFCFVHNKD